MVLSLDEAKKHLKVDLDYTLEDDLILSQIKTAVAWCEKYTGLSFSPKQVQMYSDKSSIDLLYGPVNSITSVKSSAGEVLEYHSQGIQHPRVYASPGFVVTYETGYTPETLPEPLKSAVKMMVADLYQNRESFAVVDRGGSVVQMPTGVTDLLRPYSRSGGLFL